MKVEISSYESQNLLSRNFDFHNSEFRVIKVEIFLNYSTKETHI